MDDKKFILDDQDPEDVLNGVLTESEKEALHNIKHELGFCIKWGVLTENMFEAMLKSMDTLVFLETEKEEPRVVKRNPYEALFTNDQARINGSHNKVGLFRRYVLLNLLKKLLGALKTHVNKELDGINVIDEETEMELKALLSPDADEEEMDLVGRTNQPDREREIVASIPVGKGRGCRHNRLTILQIRSDKSLSGSDELHKYCKVCRQVIHKEVLGQKTEKRSRSIGFFPPQECYHPRVHWKEGEEGKTAVCSKCESLVPNPETYRWTESGLEPFGDDPNQDEMIRIPSHKKEIAV